MKILLLCDPHYDFALAEKREFFQQDPGEIDAIVVAGDVANDEWSCDQFFSLWDRYDVPKFAVPGNHDLWWGPDALQQRTPDDFHAMARAHGFQVPRRGLDYEIVDGVLLFNVRYRADLQVEDLADTNDERFFHVMDFARRMNAADARPVRFSVSHLCAQERVPSRFPGRSTMYYNSDIDLILRAHQSPTHFFGHTHESSDTVVDGVRYVNRCVGYETPLPVLRPLSTYVVDLGARAT